MLYEVITISGPSRSASSWERISSFPSRRRKGTRITSYNVCYTKLLRGVFSGETDTAGDNDAIDAWVASLEGSPLGGLTLGASWISDLAESDIGLVTDESLYHSSVPGAAAFLSATCGPFTLEGEYVTATKRFEKAVAAVGEDLTGSKPRRNNFV